jgi:two-component system cell cycle response regulator
MNDPMKILVAEDDATSLFMLQSLLEKWGYETVALSDGVEALSVLNGEDPPFLAILDWMLPGLSGPEICRRLRMGEEARKGRPYQYIIMLTVKGEKENVVAGLDAGADDYVTKPFDSQELQMRIKVGERILLLQEQLRKAALYDALTGLPNRRAVIDGLEGEFARSERSGESFAIALLDLDHFKEVNDRYGHLTGDSVLAESARRIRSAVRSYDLVGRYGGEEFLLVFPGLKGDDALRICERVCSVIEKKPFFPAPQQGSGTPFTVTASLGICEWNPSSSGPDEMLMGADQALYRAKRKGRNAVCL